MQYARFKWLLLLWAALACWPGRSLAQTIRINEFMAANPGRPVDPLALYDMDGNSPGWVELFNQGDEPVDLTGWALSDTEDRPGKWVFAGPAPGDLRRTIIPAKGYLIVFCGGVERNVPGVEPHTEFRLDDSGVILLSRPDGKGGLVVESRIGTTDIPYPNQRRGVAYGVAGNQNASREGYFLVATPGAPNSAEVFHEFCEDVGFSRPRGLVTEAFTLTLTSPTPGAGISYTLNGDIPTDTHGTVVPPSGDGRLPSVTIQVAGSTIVRARAWKPGFGASRVGTHSYIFPREVLIQSGPLSSMALKEEDTNEWGQYGSPLREFPGPDWSVDSRIVEHPVAENRFTEEDLRALPIVSLVTSWVEAFGPKQIISNAPPVEQRGFYVGAEVKVPNEGAKRAASFEFIDISTNEVGATVQSPVQVDGSVHVFGGTSQQRWKSYKLSMNFRADRSVEHKFYTDNGEKDQRTFILDARLNNSWTHPDPAQQIRGDYVRDHVMADLQNALSGVSFHSRPVHLFLNGLYWGLYILHERPDSQFMVDYIGGDEDDWDIIKHSGSVEIDGGTLMDNVVESSVVDFTHPLGSEVAPGNEPYKNSTALKNYEDMLDIIGIGRVAPNPTPSLHKREPYEAVQAILDIPAFIDYMLINFLGANSDWGTKNLYASFPRDHPDPKWRWFTWDAEHTFRAPGENQTERYDPHGPTAIHQKLVVNTEYRLAFADAVHRHLFNDGLLSTKALQAAFDARFNEIGPSGIRGESARWGDNRSASDPYTYTGTWLKEKQRILNEILPVRASLDRAVSNSLLNQLRATFVYPSVDAPDFWDDASGIPRHGGVVPASFRLRIVDPASTGDPVYVTLDGSDPREAWTGEPSSNAVVYSAPITLDRSAQVKARIRNGTRWSALETAYFVVDAVAPKRGDLVVSEINYRPSEPTALEAASRFERRGVFEFIELLNVTQHDLALKGVRFTEGIDFEFLASSPIQVLAPGKTAVVVANVEAFRFRYGTNVPIAGQFLNGSNLDDGGESITLVANESDVLFSTKYGDKLPWPESADGNGYTLILRTPRSGTDPDDPDNWRPSAKLGGSPGYDEGLKFGDWAGSNGVHAPEKDEDADGRTNLAEYFFGSNPNSPDPGLVIFPAVSSSPGGETRVSVSFNCNTRATDILYELEFSYDLRTWTRGLVREAIVPLNETERFERWRSTGPIDPTRGFFIRINITSNGISN